MSNQITMSNVRFRTKFVKRLENCSDSLRSKLEEITIEFVNTIDDDECLKILWSMTYNPSETVKVFGLQTSTPENEETAGNVIIIPEDLILPWRDELRHQRKILHKNFLAHLVSKSCEEAYTALLKSSDAVITSIVYKACNKLCLYFTETDIERSLFLMTSTREENVFGGIRSLHFNKLEALVLKNYASQIHDLLEALWNEQVASKKLEVATPLADQLKAWCENHEVTDDADDDCPEVTSDGVTVEASAETPAVTSGESTSTNSEVSEEDLSSQTFSTPTEMLEVEKKLTPQNILEDAEFFEIFIGAYHQLKETGYDIQKVVDKMDAIVKILEASKILDD